MTVQCRERLLSFLRRFQNSASNTCLRLAQRTYHGTYG